MKIVCDNCSAKYQISDDKVRNKTFKIRCKKCSHIIVVRGGDQDALGADSEPGVDEQRPMAAMADEPAAPAEQANSDTIWHVVINREQVGPLSPAQVEGYFHSGDLDAESFIWAEGMADWSRLASIPQFSHLAPAPAVAAKPAAAAAPARAAAPAAATGGMFPSEDDDVIASNNVADATARAPSSMFPDEEEPVGPRISTASQLRNQRNENSVLFSLDTLAAEADHRKAKRAASTGSTEASGLIDITALTGLDAAGGRGDDPFGSGMGMAPAPITAAAAIQPLVAPPSSNKTLLIVAIVLVVLLLIGGAAGGMYFLMKKDPPAEPVASAEPAPTKVTMGTPPPVEPPAAAAPAPAAAVAPAAEEGADAVDDAADGDDEPKADDDDKAGAAKATAQRSRTRRPATPRPSAAAQADNEDDPPSEAARPERQVQVTKRAAPARPRKESTDEVDALLGGLDTPAGGSRPAAPGASPAAAPAAGADPMLAEKLSRQQILTVVKRNAPSIQSCKAGTDASGTVPVEIVIGRSGRVESASVEGAHSGTPVGSCVERKVRAFRFPQFSGEPMRIKMPFSL